MTASVVICPDCMGFGYFELPPLYESDDIATIVECESCAGLGYIDTKGEILDDDQ